MIIKIVKYKMIMNKYNFGIRLVHYRGTYTIMLLLLERSLINSTNCLGAIDKSLLRTKCIYSTYIPFYMR